MDMSDFSPGEVPTIVHEGFGQSDLGPERSEFDGRVGASDVLSQTAIPHFKDGEKHLTKLLGTMDEEKWISIGVEFRLAGSQITGPAADMVKDMMAEVVYQLKARNNGLSPEDQGIVLASSRPVREVTEVITKLPPGASYAVAEVLDDMLSFDSLDQLKKLAGAITEGLEKALTNAG